jgi:pimeloyl-ACP methyl ester carboxylesterase
MGHVSSTSTAVMSPMEKRRQMVVGGQGTQQRTVDVVTAGETTGVVLLYHSGTPAGPAAFEPVMELASKLGLGCVLVARPGYGHSSDMPGRKVADVVDDTLSVLDQLGSSDFVTVGWSGGGPHALACARFAPQRCRAAVVVAGVAPALAEGLDWSAGMGAENLEEFELARQPGEAFEKWLSEAAAAMGALKREDLGAGLGDLVSARDLEAIGGPIGDGLIASMTTMLEGGVGGWRDDDVAFLQEWGFEVSDVTVPTLVVQGSEDRMVPVAHGEWLASQIPSAELIRLEGEGHLSVWLRAELIAEWLAPFVAEQQMGSLS